MTMAAAGQRRTAVHKALVDPAQHSNDQINPTHHFGGSFAGVSCRVMRHERFSVDFTTSGRVAATVPVPG